MKLSQFFAIFVIIFVASAAAQGCGNANCRGGRNVGHGGRGCLPSTRWYYDQRTRRCHQMPYRGCGGNANKWCTRVACVRRCQR